MPGDFGEFTVNIGLGINFLAGGTLYLNSNDTLSYVNRPTVYPHHYSRLWVGWSSCSQCLWCWCSACTDWWKPAQRVSLVKLSELSSLPQKSGDQGLSSKMVKQAIIMIMINILQGGRRKEGRAEQGVHWVEPNFSLNWPNLNVLVPI